MTKLKKILLVVVALLCLVYVSALATSIDPEEQRPGTRLAGNLIAESETDWSSMQPPMQPGQKVFMQTNTWYGIAHSVTTVSFVVDGQLYIPCGWCDGKLWPTYVAEDPNVVVKVGDNIYERRAEIVADQEKLRARLGIEPDKMPGAVLYHMAARN